MKHLDSAYYLDFFKKELKENLLSFWLCRCLDEKNGGYFNCFSNDGSRLVSKDKYTWSQGRFLWMFSKLAMTTSSIFDDSERKQFLSLAKSGRDFLLQNVLLAPDDFRCVFLMEEDGTPKYVNGYKELDMSISADCFVVLGFAKYALAASDRESWDFAKKLYISTWDRYQTTHYRSLPYPLSDRYTSHGKFMMLTHVSVEMLSAAKIFDPEYVPLLEERIRICHQTIFREYMDQNHLIHEFKYADGTFAQNLFGQHINPGHTLEDIWFQVDAADALGCDEFRDYFPKVVKSTFRTGWDKEFGGLLHFATCDGKGVTGDPGDAADEPQMALVLDDWGSKLWWVHSEGLYTLLLMLDRTGDEEFAQMFQALFRYTYETFPNPDLNIREWIQIRTREGKPQEKVVALPVKDPYHIIRNVILIIELLEQKKGESK